MEIGNMQGLAARTTISVGGGVGDASADITYSTKPNNLITNYETGAIATTTNYNLGVGGTTGSVIGVVSRIGDDAADITYSTKPDNLLVGTTGLGLGQTTTTTIATTTGNIMGIGGGL